MSAPPQRRCASAIGPRRGSGDHVERSPGTIPPGRPLRRGRGYRPRPLDLPMAMGDDTITRSGAVALERVVAKRPARRIQAPPRRHYLAAAVLVAIAVAAMGFVNLADRNGFDRPGGRGHHPRLDRDLRLATVWLLGSVPGGLDRPTRDRELAAQRVPAARPSWSRRARSPRRGAPPCRLATTRERPDSGRLACVLLPSVRGGGTLCRRPLDVAAAARRWRVRVHRYRGLPRPPPMSGSPNGTSPSGRSSSLTGGCTSSG